MVRITTRAQQVALRAVLFCDKAKAGSHGRALLSDVPALGLEAKDRLEPNALCANVAALDDHPLPASFCFLRPSRGTLTRHHNPIRSEATGVSAQNTGIDWLHTLRLGVLAVLLGNLPWEVFLANIYQCSGPQSSILAHSANHFRTDLFRWYKDERTASRLHTEVQQFVRTMLGAQTVRTLHLHASETNGLLHYCDHMFPAHAAKLGPRGEAFCRATHNAVELVRVIKANPPVVNGLNNKRLWTQCCSTWAPFGSWASDCGRSTTSWWSWPGGSS